MFQKSFLFFLILFSLAFSVRASVVISEIMYDVEDSDAGREWVEIQNTGPQIDLTGWKFFENGVNHGLILAQGNIFLPQNGFAVIADNTEKFFLDWPGFSGTLFDSSFSLSNTGETFILRDAGLADTDSVSYSSDSGANGDGKSLQKINNEWVSAFPTPGEQGTETATEEKISPPYEGGVPGAETEGKGVSGSIPEPKPSPFKAYADSDRFALAGAEIYLEGGAEGVSEDMVSKTRFLWNFGDGTIGEGKNVKHIFQYPGNYIINLNVSFGAYSASDSAKVSVSPAGIEISEIKPGAYIEIKSESSKISDVSGFGIKISDSKVFNFPKNTLLSPNSFWVLSSEVLGLEIPDAGEIKILYPNGKILASSKYESGILGEKKSLNFDGSPPAGGWVKSESTPGAKNKITPTLPSTRVEGSTPPYKGGETKTSKIVPPPLQGGVGGGIGEASVINSQAGASLWSEIKWLIFGIGGGVLIGTIYIFIKRKFLKNQATI